MEVLLKRERLNTRVAAMAIVAPIAAGAAPPPSNLLNNLPTRDIEIFDGRIEKFPPFWQTFCGQVDQTSAPTI